MSDCQTLNSIDETYKNRLFDRMLRPGQKLAVRCTLPDSYKLNCLEEDRRGERIDSPTQVCCMAVPTCKSSRPS